MINPSKLCLKATQTEIHWLKSKSLLKNPHLYKTQPAAGKNSRFWQIHLGLLAKNRSNKKACANSSLLETGI